MYSSITHVVLRTRVGADLTAHMRTLLEKRGHSFTTTAELAIVQWCVRARAVRRRDSNALRRRLMIAIINND